MSERLGDWSGEELEAAGQEVLHLISTHFANIDETPVLPETGARALQELLAAPIPEDGEPFDRILDDTKNKVIPNLTLWNHPGFYAYFSTPGSIPGALADLLISSLNVNLFNWKSAPAGSALEQVVLGWMAEMAGYDPAADGVLVNGASLATFYALAAAREASGLNIREEGLIGRDLPVLRVYATEHAHSSIDKAVMALGLGLRNLVKIEADEYHRMRPDKLREAIAADLAKGYRPMAAVAVAGTTSTGACDPLEAVGAVCREYGVWLHIDGAYGGFYNLVPEVRAGVDSLMAGDSLVVNPHKGLWVPLEVSALYCRRKGALAAAFSLISPYLRTEPQDGSVNYMDYSLQLGRNFRALKVWWVIRTFGRKGLVERMRFHLRLARGLASQVQAHRDFVQVASSPYPLVCLRAFPHDLQAEFAEAGGPRRQAISDYLDRLNAAVMERVNSDRSQFISHSVVREGYILRVSVGNLRTTEAHLAGLWERIRQAAAEADAALRPSLG